MQKCHKPQGLEVKRARLNSASEGRGRQGEMTGALSEPPTRLRWPRISQGPTVLLPPVALSGIRQAGFHGTKTPLSTYPLPGAVAPVRLRTRGRACRESQFSRPYRALRPGRDPGRNPAARTERTAQWPGWRQGSIVLASQARRDR